MQSPLLPSASDAPPPAAPADVPLRDKVRLVLWMAVLSAIVFAVGDAMSGSNAVPLLLSARAAYLLALPLAFRALRRARDDRAVARVALAALGFGFAASVFATVLRHDPVSTLVVCGGVALVGAAFLGWTVRDQVTLVGLAMLAVIARTTIAGGFASLFSFPVMVVAAWMAISVYLCRFVDGYRAAAAAAEIRLKEEAEVSAALARVGRELIASLDSDTLLTRLAQLTVEVLGCQASHTWLRREDGTFQVAAGVSDDPPGLESLRALRLPAESLIGQDLLARLRSDGPLALTPAEVEALPTRELQRRHAVATVLLFPLCRGDDIVGIQAALYRLHAPPPPPTAHRIAAGLAQLASLAMETARLVEATQTASRRNTEFLAKVSHELRTPLNVVIGYNDMLLDGGCGPLNPEQHDVLDRAQQNARELLDLMQATLELSRHDARPLTVLLEPVALPGLLADLASQVSALPQIPGVEFRYSVAPDLPPIMTDELKLRMLVKNLLDNARKHTAAGHIALSARAEGDGFEIAVADTGRGIAPEDLGRIFEPFRQTASGQHAGGVGLGLYLVRRLAEALGGQVGVDSRLGEGSTFRLWLPARPVPD